MTPNTGSEVDMLIQKYAPDRDTPIERLCGYTGLLRNDLPELHPQSVRGKECTWCGKVRA